MLPKFSKQVEYCYESMKKLDERLLVVIKIWSLGNT